MGTSPLQMGHLGAEGKSVCTTNPDLTWVGENLVGDTPLYGDSSGCRYRIQPHP